MDGTKLEPSSTVKREEVGQGRVHLPPEMDRIDVPFAKRRRPAPNVSDVRRNKQARKAAAAAATFAKSKPLQAKSEPDQSFTLAPYLRHDDNVANDILDLVQSDRLETTWDMRKGLLDNPVVSIHLLPAFKPTNDHLDDLFQRGRSFWATLEDFRAGSLDVSLTDLADKAIGHLAAACPNLKQIQMLGADRLTHSSVDLLTRHCPKLEYIEISGSETHDQGGGRGAIKLRRPFPSLRRGHWSACLRKLVVRNQPFLEEKLMKKIVTMRPGLEIVYGDTSNNGRGLKTAWLKPQADHAQDSDEFAAKTIKAGEATKKPEYISEGREVIFISDDEDGGAGKGNREFVVISDDED